MQYVSNYNSFIKERRTLHSTISSIDTRLLDNTEPVPTRTLPLLGNGSRNLNNNFKMITVTIKYILSIKKFDDTVVTRTPATQKITKINLIC